LCRQPALRPTGDKRPNPEFQRYINYTATRVVEVHRENY
jgi:hypothetical protein